MAHIILGMWSHCSMRMRTTILVFFYFRSKDHSRSSVAILRRALFSASFKPVWLHVKFFPQLFLNACMTRVKTNLGDEQASQWLFTLIDHYLIKFVNDLDTFFSPRLWLCTGIESELFFPPFSGSMIPHNYDMFFKITCFLYDLHFLTFANFFDKNWMWLTLHNLYFLRFKLYPCITLCLECVAK